MALVKEALNLRAGDAIYRSMNAYLEHADAAAPGGYDSSIDMDLRSGIGLGTGLSALMLSLLPGKVTKVRLPSSCRPVLRDADPPAL